MREFSFEVPAEVAETLDTVSPEDRARILAETLGPEEARRVATGIRAVAEEAEVAQSEDAFVEIRFAADQQGEHNRYLTVSVWKAGCTRSCMPVLVDTYDIEHDESFSYEVAWLLEHARGDGQ